MTDGNTTNLLLTEMEDNSHQDMWGAILRANDVKIDKKIGDVTSLSLTGGTYTLTETEERVNAIVVSGVLTANQSLVFSGRGGSWIVKNDTTGAYSLTCKVSGQTGVGITQGGATEVWSTNTDIARAQSGGNQPSFSATMATLASISGTTPTKMTGFSEEWDTGGYFTSSRWTPTISGTGMMTFTLFMNNSGPTDDIFYLQFRKNGSVMSEPSPVPGLDTTDKQYVSRTIIFTTTGSDYFELYYVNDRGSSVELSDIGWQGVIF